MEHFCIKNVQHEVLFHCPSVLREATAGEVGQRRAVRSHSSAQLCLLEKHGMNLDYYFRFFMCHNRVLFYKLYIVYCRFLTLAVNVSRRFPLITGLTNNLLNLQTLTENDG